MRQFIGNPFQSEFEEDDGLDEFEFEDVVRIIEADRVIVPAEELEEDEDWVDDDEDDPDYVVQDNDGYDSSADNLEFSDESDIEDNNVHYVFRDYSSNEEDDDELDYVTFAVSENHSQDTTSKSTNQESSNSSISNEEADFMGDET